MSMGQPCTTARESWRRFYVTVHVRHRPDRMFATRARQPGAVVEYYNASVTAASDRAASDVHSRLAGGLQADRHDFRPLPPAAAARIPVASLSAFWLQPVRASPHFYGMPADCALIAPAAACPTSATRDWTSLCHGAGKRCLGSVNAIAVYPRVPQANAGVDTPNPAQHQRRRLPGHAGAWLNRRGIVFCVSSSHAGIRGRLAALIPSDYEDRCAIASRRVEPHTAASILIAPERSVTKPGCVLGRMRTTSGTASS